MNVSATCQTNPLKQLIAKGDQVHTRSFASNFSHESATRQQQQQQHVSVEHFFLNNDSTHLNSGDRFLQVQQPVQLSPSERQESNVGNSWLNQFSSMKVEDPLEFSKEYKNLYANYESQQPKQQQRTAMSPTLQRTMYHQPMNSYFNVVERSTFQTTSDHTAMDAYFNTEFDALERELEESSQGRVENLSRRSSDTRTTTYDLDDEQLEFQQIANNIVDSCSSVSNSPSPVGSKLSGSKFMGLMRGISDGSITLKKSNDRDDEDQRTTEFHSPITGELVGNEYFPVFDNIHDTI